MARSGRGCDEPRNAAPWARSWVGSLRTQLSPPRLSADRLGSRYDRGRRLRAPWRIVLQCLTHPQALHVRPCCIEPRRAIILPPSDDAQTRIIDHCPPLPGALGGEVLASHNMVMGHVHEPLIDDNSSVSERPPSGCDFESVHTIDYVWKCAHTPSIESVCCPKCAARESRRELTDTSTTRSFKVGNRGSRLHEPLHTDTVRPP